VLRSITPSDVSPVVLLVLTTSALLDSNGEGQGWKDCMAHLKKYVTHKVTKPFIDNVRVPGQDEPGLTFKVGKVATRRWQF
jgi:hypothetical protein